MIGESGNEGFHVKWAVDHKTLGEAQASLKCYTKTHMRGMLWEYKEL